jgi:hypothetical protein
MYAGLILGLFGMGVSFLGRTLQKTKTISVLFGAKERSRKVMRKLVRASLET